MMTERKSGDIPGIDEVRARFEDWRHTRRGKARIPDELWSAAITVARRDGINQTAAALRLDGGTLKRLMLAAKPLPRKAMPAPTFVELMTPHIGACLSAQSNWKARTASCESTGRAPRRRMLVD
jgi:hypothetical protein